MKTYNFGLTIKKAIELAEFVPKLFLLLAINYGLIAILILFFQEMPFVVMTFVIAILVVLCEIKELPMRINQYYCLKFLFVATVVEVFLCAFACFPKVFPGITLVGVSFLMLFLACLAFLLSIFISQFSLNVFSSTGYFTAMALLLVEISALYIVGIEPWLCTMIILPLLLNFALLTALRAELFEKTSLKQEDFKTFFKEGILS